MKRHIPGLHSRQQNGEAPGRPVPGPCRMGLLPLASTKAFFQVRFVVLEPNPSRAAPSLVGSIAPNELSGS